MQLDTVDVLIANNDIATGVAVSPQDFRWQTWPTAAAGAAFIKKTDRPDAINQLAGSITRGPFFDGEPIREAKLIRADGSGYMAAILPTGMRAVSTDISPETGAGGFILPNDHVDVILTRRDPLKATRAITPTTLSTLIWFHLTDCGVCSTSPPSATSRPSLRVLIVPVTWSSHRLFCSTTSTPISPLSTNPLIVANTASAAPGARPLDGSSRMYPVAPETTETASASSSRWPPGPYSPLITIRATRRRWRSSAAAVPKP